jgi:hypothetical protein
MTNHALSTLHQRKASEALDQLPQLRAQVLQLQQQLHSAQDEAAIANRQEQLTHDALHDWKDHCSRYYMALRYLPIYAERQLADCHSPAAVLADLLEFARTTLEHNPYTPSPSEAPAEPSPEQPPFGLVAAHANAQPAKS